MTVSQMCITWHYLGGHSIHVNDSGPAEGYLYITGLNTQDDSAIPL